MFSQFLADRPVLKDRLFACAVFSGIAVGGVSGLNMIITGGFDFLTPGREVRQAAPSAFETVVPSNWFEQGQAIPMTSTEPLFAGEPTQVSDNLDGGSDAAPPTAPSPAADDSGDELYRQLAAQYDDNATQAAQSIQPAVVVAPDDKTSAPVAPDDSEATFYAPEAQVQEALPAEVLPDIPPA